MMAGNVDSSKQAQHTPPAQKDLPRAWWQTWQFGLVLGLCWVAVTVPFFTLFGGSIERCTTTADILANIAYVLTWASLGIIFFYDKMVQPGLESAQRWRRVINGLLFIGFCIWLSLTVRGYYPPCLGLMFG
ncbi:MAG: hypothetical protein MUD01_10770 [Chloroflexaceae bacterium]|jgi:threonine/homoserine/homoserine lactone efflux protein|nr:hypothetical protein [Chloroflexaceae bacterium]